MNLRQFLLTAAVTPLFLAACSSTPVTPAPPSTARTVGPATAPAPATSAASPKPATSGTVASTALPEYLDPKNPLSRDRSVFFGFDEFVVTPEYAPLIERHGKFLAQHSTVPIRIEGHTDERGGAEYNLALGQRRSEAVLKALRIYGVKDSQMEAVSYGKESPKASGHDETAWAQNRRADLVYPTK